MLKQKILLRKYRNIFSVLVRFFLLYFLKSCTLCTHREKLNSGSQEVSGSIPLFSTKENLEAIMVSRFFLIYGKLHKVAFVLNLCWTRGKIAHNPPFLATHFCNFFYIFIISTFYTNALIGKGFFCPFKKAQSKKCIFLSTLSFLLLCWISCWITNSSPLFSRTGTLVVPVPPHRS